MSKLVCKPSSSAGLMYDVDRLEELLIKIGDAFDIRITWNEDDTNLTVGLAMIGGIIGAFKKGMGGALAGAAMGAAAGVAVVSLRQLWPTIKEKLMELLDMLFDYLSRLNITDYYKALNVIMSNETISKDLVTQICGVIACKLGREVVSSVTNA